MCRFQPDKNSPIIARGQRVTVLTQPGHPVGTVTSVWYNVELQRMAAEVLLPGGVTLFNVPVQELELVPFPLPSAERRTGP